MSCDDASEVVFVNGALFDTLRERRSSDKHLHYHEFQKVTLFFSAGHSEPPNVEDLPDPNMVRGVQQHGGASEKSWCMLTPMTQDMHVHERAREYIHKNGTLLLTHAGHQQTTVSRRSRKQQDARWHATISN